MKTLLHYALAALFAFLCGVSFIYAATAPRGYGFALVAIGAIAMNGYRIFANKAGDRDG